MSLAPSAGWICNDRPFTFLPLAAPPPLSGGDPGGDRGEGPLRLRESGGVPAGHHEQPGAAHTETYPLNLYLHSIYFLQRPSGFIYYTSSHK